MFAGAAVPLHLRSRTAISACGVVETDMYLPRAEKGGVGVEVAAVGQPHPSKFIGPC